MRTIILGLLARLSHTGLTRALLKGTYRTRVQVPLGNWVEGGRLPKANHHSTAPPQRLAGEFLRLLTAPVSCVCVCVRVVRVQVACPWTNGSPCNNHFRELGDVVCEAVEAAGGKPVIFGTPVVTDGEAQGMEAMRYSLASRDLIADCIEMMHEAYRQWTAPPL